MKRKMMYAVMAVVLLFLGGCENKNSVTSLDSDEQDVRDLLLKAKQSASNEHFSAAREALEEARKIDGSNSAEYQKVSAYVGQKIDERDERLERERQAKLERERQERMAAEAAQRQANYDASGNAGGSLSCSRVSSDYALWSYCTAGKCDGFSSNYGLWRLCEHDALDGLSGNYNIWSYLQNGNTGGFTGTAYKGAEQNKGSFADRKRFVLYYMRGYVYYH